MSSGKPSIVVIERQRVNGFVLVAEACKKAKRSKSIIYAWVKQGFVGHVVEKSTSRYAGDRGFLFVNLEACKRMAGVR